MDKVKQKKKKNRIDEFLEKKEAAKVPVSKKEAEEYVKNMHKGHVAKEERMEKLKQKVIAEEEKGKEANVAAYESNKFVLKNVMKRYKNIVSTLFASIYASTNVTSNNSITNEQENNNQIEKKRKYSFE